MFFISNQIQVQVARVLKPTPLLYSITLLTVLLLTDQTPASHVDRRATVTTRVAVSGEQVQHSWSLTLS